MNSLYPMMINLNGKNVVVIGGGRVAERKVLGLAGTGASITVVSPAATEKLAALAQEGIITFLQRSFLESDVCEAFMIFAASDDPKLNRRVKDCAKPHQLVMLADDPDRSDFHLPARLQRGHLTIAVSTGGASPNLAKKIRNQLSEQFDSVYEEYLEFLFWKRQWILKEVTDSPLKQKLLMALASDMFLNSKDRERDFQQLYREMREADSD